MYFTIPAMELTATNQLQDTRIFQFESFYPIWLYYIQHAYSDRFSDVQLYSQTVSLCINHTVVVFEHHLCHFEWYRVYSFFLFSLSFSLCRSVLLYVHCSQSLKFPFHCLDQPQLMTIGQIFGMFIVRLSWLVRHKSVEAIRCRHQNQALINSHFTWNDVVIHDNLY